MIFYLMYLLILGPRVLYIIGIKWLTVVRLTLQHKHQRRILLSAFATIALDNTEIFPIAAAH